PKTVSLPNQVAGARFQAKVPIRRRSCLRQRPFPADPKAPKVPCRGVAHCTVRDLSRRDLITHGCPVLEMLGIDSRRAATLLQSLKFVQQLTHSLGRNRDLWWVGTDNAALWRSEVRNHVFPNLITHLGAGLGKTPGPVCRHNEEPLCQRASPAIQPPSHIRQHLGDRAFHFQTRASLPLQDMEPCV